MLEERLSELNTTLKALISALANVGVTVNNMPGIPAPQAKAAAPEAPAKRGPGRPPAAKAEPTPPKAAAKPPKQPDPEPEVEEPAPEPEPVKAPAPKVTIDDVRAQLMEIMSWHNRQAGDPDGKKGPGAELTRKLLEKISGHERLPGINPDNFPSVLADLREAFAELQSGEGSDEAEEGFE